MIGNHTYNFVPFPPPPPLPLSFPLFFGGSGVGGDWGVQEVQAVIAHELGHLKCEHGIWVTLATVLANGLYRGGFLGAFLADRLGLRRSLMRWSRAAEFTCDRAAMLVAQDVNVVVSTLLKLAGGSVKQVRPRLKP